MFDRFKCYQKLDDEVNKSRPLFHLIELFCLAAFHNSCNNALGKCLRKYSIIVLLKAVENNQFGATNESALSGSNESVTEEVLQMLLSSSVFSIGVIVACSPVGFINLLTSVVRCCRCRGQSFV